MTYVVRCEGPDYGELWIAWSLRWDPETYEDRMCWCLTEEADRAHRFTTREAAEAAWSELGIDDCEHWVEEVP